MYYSTTYLSPLGTITLGCDSNNNLVGLWFETTKHHGEPSADKMTENNNMPIFHQTKEWLDRYFSGKNPAISELQLAPIGGEFRQIIWNLLCEIPYGEVITYGDIAKRAAKKMKKEKMSSQAVGGAVGHNPISIIIPCHRVIGTKGNLTGYGGGINTKVKLLELEKVNMTSLYIPKKGTAL